MSGEFTNRLKDMQDAWEGNRDGFKSIPAGQYEAQVQEAFLRETQKGKIRANVKYLVLDGEFEGDSVYEGWNLDPEKPAGMSFLATWLETLGYDVPGPQEPELIEDLLEEIGKDAPVVRIQVTEKDGFTNVKILDVISSGAEEGGEDAPEDDEEGNAPEGEDEGEQDENFVILLALIQQYDDGMTDESTLEDITKGLNEYEWDQKGDGLTEKEVAALESVDVIVTGKSAPKKKTKAKATKKKAARKR